METDAIMIGTLDDAVDALAFRVTAQVRDEAAIVWVNAEGSVYCSPLWDREDAIRNDIVGMYDAAEPYEDIVGDFKALIADRARERARNR